MRVFSDEEFDQMICEVICDKPKYDTLCMIVEKVLKPSTINWCSSGIMHGRITADDLLLDIQIKVIKNIVTGFVKNKRANGGINYDPGGFNSWLFRTAKNLRNDISDELERKYGREICIESIIDKPYSNDKHTIEEAEIHYHNLSKAFNVVLNSDRKVYITLTWIAQSLFVIQYDLKRPEATEIIIKEFQSKTLFDMWKIIHAFSKQVPWLTVTTAQRQRISTALCTPLKEDILLGELRYEELFMSKGPNQTISDWVNRIDNMIKDRMKYESFNNN